MSKGTRSLEMANLVCRFGDSVLLDHFESLVYPAFTEDLVRSYGDADYFFSSVSLEVLSDDDSEPVLGVVGRFIKDGKLTREQVYKDGELQRNRRSMQSSPSALFVLVLNNHRLIYVKETPDAPSKSAFRSTLHSFLKQVHKEFVKENFALIDEDIDSREERKAAKDEFSARFPPPTLQVIALSTEDSVEKFISRYDVLKQIKITFTETNDESPMGKFFAKLKESKEAIDSEATSIIHRAKDGLDKEEAVAQVSSATEQGINSVTLRGIDEGGDILLGNNEKFQLKKPVEDLSDNPVEAAKEMYETFADLVKTGVVKVDKTKGAAKKLLRAIRRKLIDE